MSPTQDAALKSFLAEYLNNLVRQLARWGTASHGYSIQTDMPLRTRDALIDAGMLEVVSREMGTATERKGYAFGRIYRSTTVPYGRIALAPTKKAMDWFVAQ